MNPFTEHDNVPWWRRRSWLAVEVTLVVLGAVSVYFLHQAKAVSRQSVTSSAAPQIPRLLPDKVGGTSP